MDSIESPTSNPRSESFGYVCHRCLKCCYHKGIQLNPYEVARLARNRGQKTSEFRAAWTVDGAGLHLAQTESGACVFLGSEGCTVHADRPLVCRLYPLGRHLTADGKESFAHVQTHPQSRGEFTQRGTIADFLSAQDAYPFMRAADEYFYWICAVRASMDEACNPSTAELSNEDDDSARDLLDMDGAIALHCAATAETEPADIETRKELHLKILYQELEATKEARHEQT